MLLLLSMHGGVTTKQATENEQRRNSSVSALCIVHGRDAKKSLVAHLWFQEFPTCSPSQGIK